MSTLALIPSTDALAAFLRLTTAERGARIATMDIPTRCAWELVYARYESISVTRARAAFAAWERASCDALEAMR